MSIFDERNRSDRLLRRDAVDPHHADVDVAVRPVGAVGVRAEFDPCAAVPCAQDCADDPDAAVPTLGGERLLQAMSEAGDRLDRDYGGSTA